MSNVVVDASVAIKWFVPEVHSDAAERWLDREIVLHAPDLIHTEVANTLWKKARRREITPQEASEIMIAFKRVPIELSPSSDLAPLALMLATSLDRTVYDSLYLTCAIAHGGFMVTADRKFYGALKASTLAKYVRWIADED